MGLDSRLYKVISTNIDEDKSLVVINNEALDVDKIGEITVEIYYWRRNIAVDFYFRKYGIKLTEGKYFVTRSTVKRFLENCKSDLEFIKNNTSEQLENEDYYCINDISDEDLKSIEDNIDSNVFIDKFFYDNLITASEILEKELTTETKYFYYERD